MYIGFIIVGWSKLIVATVMTYSNIVDQVILCNSS